MLVACHALEVRSGFRIDKDNIYIVFSLLHDVTLYTIARFFLQQGSKEGM